MMLRGSDAIEVKKMESRDSDISLNSSYPKAVLHASSPGICRIDSIDETWVDKDLLYVIGWIPKNTKRLKRIWFVYGDCFIAKKDVYEQRVDKSQKGNRKNLQY